MDNPVADSPLFRGLAPDQVQSVRERLVRVGVTRGGALYREDEPGDSLYVIESGTVKLGRHANDGRQHLLGIAGPSELIGELCLFDPGLRTATATALTETVAYRMAHDDLTRWLVTAPSIAEHLLRVLSRRLRRTHETLAGLIGLDASGRLAWTLLDLSQRFGAPTADGVRVDCSLTQQELAQLVGAARETVNKVLADFVGSGWVRHEGRSVVLLDTDQLRHCFMR
ncbi:MAG: Crp/Fnr family transcriptional regulator [Micrococcales bacterium]|nr:Crp/Fnr family transcriptional regulator [Micrococcales bacterium]